MIDHSVNEKREVGFSYT